MPKVADLKAMPPKILGYGPAGSAKTALALTLGERSLFLDCDGNLDVAFGLKDNFQTDRQVVEVKQFLDVDPHKPVAAMRLRSYILGLVNECNAGNFAYDAIVLDSLTAVAAHAEAEIMSNSGKVGKNPQIQHWGMILTEIYNVVYWLRSLPVVVVVLAHETTFTSEDVNQIQIAIPGQKLPGKITRMFSEIWYFRIRNVGGGGQELYLQTVPTQSITCRSGRGLPTNTKFGTIDKTGKPGKSVGMWELLEKIERKEKTPT